MMERFGGADSNAQGSEKQKSGAKKRFLTRGSGTAGGKQGHKDPKKPQPKATDKKKSANQLLSDEEYPNDFNYAVEQDKKSPKLHQQ